MGAVKRKKKKKSQITLQAQRDDSDFVTINDFFFFLNCNLLISHLNVFVLIIAIVLQY